MTLLEKHRGDFKTLNKSELHEIITECLKRNKVKREATTYDPLNSKRNNARRAIKRLWSRRADGITRLRIRRHINVLRNL